MSRAGKRLHGHVSCARDDSLLTQRLECVVAIRPEPVLVVEHAIDLSSTGATCLCGMGAGVFSFGAFVPYMGWPAATNTIATNSNFPMLSAVTAV